MTVSLSSASPWKSAAARATAPPGSTTIFSRLNAKPWPQRLLVGDDDAGACKPLQDRESDLAGLGRHDRVADRAGHRRIALDPARGQRTRRVVEILRLAGPHGEARRTRFERQRDARTQPAAAAGNEDLGRLHAFLLRLFGNLKPGRALAGDHQRFVERLDQRQTALGRKPGADRIAILFCAVVEHHLGAECAGVLDFQDRRIGWHDDDGGHGVQLGRKGDALRVVAG